MVNFYKSEISLLKDQNFFLKSELQQKQIIVEKLLDLQQKDNQKLLVPFKYTISTIIIDPTLIINLTVKK